MDFLGRLKYERAELVARLDPLTLFLQRGAPGVEPSHVTLLEAQHHAMNLYQKILDMRLTHLAAPKKAAVASEPVQGEPVEIGGHNEDKDGPVPFSD